MIGFMKIDHSTGNILNAFEILLTLGVITYSIYGNSTDNNHSKNI